MLHGSLLRRIMLTVVSATLLACVMGQRCDTSPVYFDRAPERPPLVATPISGRSAAEAIQVRPGESAIVGVTIEGGQGPYFVTFHYQDGTEPYMTPANLLVSPPLATDTHAFNSTGLFVVSASVIDAYDRTTSVSIYVRVLDTVQPWQSARIAVEGLTATYQGPSSSSSWQNSWAQDPGASGATQVSVSLYEQWESDEGTYIEDAFGMARLDTRWNRPSDISEYAPSEGRIEVSFDRQTLMVTAFHATKTVSVPRFDASPRIQTATISGSGVQLGLRGTTDRILYGELTGQAACNAISALTDRFVADDQTTTLTAHSCGFDARLIIVIYPDTLPW